MKDDCLLAGLHFVQKGMFQIERKDGKGCGERGVEGDRRIWPEKIGSCWPAGLLVVH